MKKILAVVFVLAMVFMANIALAIDIDTDDIPLSTKCCLKMPTEYGMTCYWASKIEWSIEKWGNIPARDWSPYIGGYRVDGDRSIEVQLVFSQEDIEFFQNAKFENTNTRKPFALEVDMVDHDEVFGKKGEDDFYMINNFPSSVKAIKDVGASDSSKQLSIIIARPDLLEKNRLYRIIFFPKETSGKSGKFSLNLQLSVNYKYLAAIKNGYSNDCDALDLIAMIHEGSSWTVDHLITKDFSGEIPDKAINGWYYFLVAKTDAMNGTFASPESTSAICWDDRIDTEHDNSEFRRCGNLFSVNSGSSYGASVPEQPPPENQEPPNISSATAPSSTSTSRPNITVPFIELKDGKTKYYHDETVKTPVRVKNSGTNVDPNIPEVRVRLYRSKGENIDTDPKSWSQNIKGENLKAGVLKSEYFEYGAPDEEDRYDEWACADTTDVVTESNENDNCSGMVSYRVHTRPDIFADSLLVNGGQTEFYQNDSARCKVKFGNSGGEPFEDIPVEWYLNGRYLTNDNIRHWNIEHGETKEEEVSINFPALAIGNHTVKACAKFSEDQDQSDNCKETIFSVVAVPLPVSVSYPLIPPLPSPPMAPAGLKIQAQ